MTTTTSEWDASEYLENPEQIAAYLNTVMEDGDPALVQAALGDIAKAQGMTQIARSSGLSRESLYKALRAEASPSFATISRVATAVGTHIRFDADTPLD